MNDKERYDIAAMLDTLTIEQKKDFLSFLQALQAQEQQHSASANTTTATDAAPDNLSREPKDITEARKRIRYMYLPDVTTQPAGLYHQAIMEYIEEAPTYRTIDLAVMMAYAAGVQHGKHIERARRKQRASLQQ